jgi:hypothetical protein
MIELGAAEPLNSSRELALRIFRERHIATDGAARFLAAHSRDSSGDNSMDHG